MKQFLKMTCGILSCFLCAKLASQGFSSPNSSAADLWFAGAIIALMGGLYCFLGDLFE